MVILGIDPGTARLGYGLIKIEKNESRLIAFGCLETDKGQNPDQRLKIIYDGLIDIIKKHKPDCLAIEQIFFFKNSKTVIAVSQARGVAILAAANLKLPVCEFTPLQVKQAITGYGRAEKQQVQKMVKALLCLKEIPKPDDAADALAVAICAAHTKNIDPSLEKDMFYVYILKSSKDKKLYIGSTNDLKRRFSQHNNGDEQSTKYRAPFVLAYYEAYASEKDARIRESGLKRFSGAYTHLNKRSVNSLILFK